MYNKTEKDNRYADIIDLPHHTSSKHPRMSAIARAAQFSPFAALTGYDAEIKETARLTDEKIELDEDSVNDINAKLQYIKDNIDDNPEITLEYFVPDEKKSGGAYLTLNDRVRIIDEYERSIVFVSGKRVMIDDIYGIILR